MMVSLTFTEEQKDKFASMLFWGAMLTLLIASSTMATAGWWNDTYRYRIGYNLSNTGSNLTDVQILFPLDLNESITNGTIRATWVNGSVEQAIAYWRSDGAYNSDVVWDTTNSSGSVWARIPSIPNGTNTSTVYFYYSDFNGLLDTNDADNTFLAYDDCSSSAGWTTLSGILVITGGASSYCRFSGLNSTITVAQANLTGFNLSSTSVVEWRQGYTAANESDNHAFLVNGNGGKFHVSGGTGYSGYAVQQADSSGAVSGLFKWATSTGTGILTMASNATWRKYKLTTNGTNMTLLIDGVAKGTTNDSTYSRGGNLAMAEFQQTTFTNNTGFYDDIRVRAQYDIDPTIAGGTQEDTGIYSIMVASNPATCGTYTAIATFNITDEDSELPSIANGTVNITSSTSGVVGGSWTFTSASSFSLCKANNSPDFNITVVVHYWNASAGTRDYYLAATNATNSVIPAYLGAIGGMSYIKFKTQDSFSNGLPNRIQQYLRYYPANATWKLVAMGMTDANGEYTASLFTNGTTFYRIYSFEPDWNATLEQTWSSEPVYCIAGQSCVYNLYITQYTPPTWWSEYGKVSWGCSFDNVSVATCSWVDGTGETHDFAIEIKKVQATGLTTVCLDNATAASGTLYCDIYDTDTNTTGVIYTMTFTRQSDLRVLDKQTYDFTTASFMAIGALFAFMIIIAVGFVGLTIPSIAPLMVVIGLAISVWAGFLQLHIAAIAALVFAALIIMWKQGGN